MRGIVRLALVLSLCAAPLLAHGSWSSVSADTGAVYKCEQGGQVAYQGVPCPLDVKQTPARREEQTQEEREAVEALVQRAEKVSQEAVRANAIEKPNGDKAALPEFDVEAHCEEYARQTGPRNATLYNLCVDNEQDSYNKSANLFGRVSQGMQRQCVEYGNQAEHGSYMLLEICLENELDAARNPSQFER